MKSIKKIIATALSVATFCAVSSYAFAALDNSKEFTLELKVEDTYGNALTTIGPDSDAYLSVYIYESDNPATEEDESLNDITIKNNNAGLSYAIVTPCSLFGDDYSGAEYESFNASVGEASITDMGDDTLIIQNDLEKLAKAGLTFNSQAPIAKHKIKISDTATTCDFSFWEDLCAMGDGTTTISTFNLLANPVTLDANTTSSIEAVPVSEDKYKDENNKTLKLISSVAKGADATKKIEIKKTLNGKTETQVTTQTLAELLGGVAKPGTTIDAKISLGVLTADTDAVFSFELK